MLATDPAEVRERVLMLLLGLYGVSLLAVPRPDVAASLVPRLSRLMVHDFARAWGADPVTLDRLTPIVREVVASHPLGSMTNERRDPVVSAV